MRYDDEGKGSTDELSPARERPNAYVARCRTIAQCHARVHAAYPRCSLIEKTLVDESLMVHLVNRDSRFV